MKTRSELVGGVFGGFMIGIACKVFLGCENKYIGSFMFALGLCGILYCSFNLYTGSIGFVTVDPKMWKTSFHALIGNIAGVMVFGVAFPSDKATALCSTKLEEPLFQVFLLAICCGMLMALAVFAFRGDKWWLTILCVAGFILAGFEHSIADACYFVMGRCLNLPSILFFLTAVAGNGVGGIALITTVDKLAKNRQDVRYCDEENDANDNDDDADE